MTNIAIVAEPGLSSTWATALSADGHVVQTFADSLGAQELFSQERFDILIIDIENADFGETMLIPQVRASWPDCKIIAIVSSYMFRSSAVYQMGLWTPDQLLLKPISTRLLLATTSFLWAQIRSQEIRSTIASVKRHPSGLPVHASPDQEQTPLIEGTWSVPPAIAAKG